MPTDLAGAATPSRRFVISHRRLANAVLWLFVFSGSLVKIEPSPYEALFPAAFLAFVLLGLRMHQLLAPLVLLLALFNAGGLISLIPHVSLQPSVMFIAISVYLAITAIFFAALMLDNTDERLAIIRKASIATGFFAALLGTAGYFSESLAAFTRNERATGAFKDPNVFGPFLVLPILWCIHELLQAGSSPGLTRRQHTALAFAAMVMTFAVFLSFSRGAWGVLAGGFILVFGLNFLTASTRAVRRRVVGVIFAGCVSLVLMLTVAASIPEVRDLLVQRASLTQDYDLGALGRFGGQMRSIPLLLESPLGFGPLRFQSVIGGEDAHNVYINAFASYGWFGGLSYFALVAMTCIVGWRLVIRPGPWRRAAIPLWSALFMQILQGFQIDTDHWRHFYLLLGLTWGLATASALQERRHSCGRGRAA